MNDTGDTSLGSLLKQFLCNPASNFNSLYRLCFTKTVAYLSVQKSRGRILPNSGSDESREIEDLAHQLLERIFLDSKPPHFRKILDYFKSQGVAEIEAISPAELQDLFLPFFYQQLRQGLDREGRLVHAESSATRKTIENILQSADFGKVPDQPKCVYYCAGVDSLRQKSPPVSRKLLDWLAYESVLTTTKTTDLCREFFRRLNEQGDCRNFVGRTELVFSLLRAIDRYVDDTVFGPARPPEPETARQLQVALASAVRALERLTTDNLRSLIEQGKITDEEGGYFAAAGQSYLADRSNGGSVAMFSEYFRESFPDSYHQRYEGTYKHRFLQLMRLALQYYTEELDVLL